MVLHPIRTYIMQYTPIKDCDWELIFPCLVRKPYAKGEILQREGSVCKKVSFLETGFLRYFMTQDGIDKTKFFTEPPYCFTSQRSLLKASPAEEGIEALEDSIVWEMNKKNAFRLLEECLPWNTFVRELVQEVQYYTEQILLESQNLTAEQRYIQMVENGDIRLQKVPLKHLASYLGVAPQSLSRIRKKYAADHRS